MFYRLIDTLDPIILNLNVQSSLQKNRIPIPKEVLHLLDIPKSEMVEEIILSGNDDQEDSDINEETDFEYLKNTELINPTRKMIS